MMLKGRNSLLSLVAEFEPVSRAVLFLVLSPSKYIASQARHCLSEMVESCGNSYLVRILASLNLIATGNITHVSANLETVVSLTLLACYCNLPQYQNLIIQMEGIQTVSLIIESCLSSDIRVSRSSIALHLDHSSNGKTCCWNHVGGWEGEDIILFYSIQALSQLISFSNFFFDRLKIKSRDDVVKKHGDSEKHNLIDRLLHVLSNNFSPGPRWYAAYILSFFGFYGAPSNLGNRIERALHEHELADLHFMLSSGQSLKVHGAILAARCPYLLPPEETFLKDGKWDVVPMNEQDTEQKQGKSKHEIRISDRVDSGALMKILEYTYTGFFLAEDDLVKPLKVLAKSCSFMPLAHMLHRKLPTWGTANPSCNFSREHLGHIPFLDIVLEAKEAEGMAWSCGLCKLTMPHMHAHKIILWASCDYLRALYRSGMHESFSQVIKVPIGWTALVKLVSYFYSGELPRIRTDCIWNNMVAEQQLQELQAYVELASLAEFWMLEEVGEVSLSVITSCLNLDQKTSLQIIQYAHSMNQWKIVEVAIKSIGHLYPKIRDRGDLENFGVEVVEMLRAEYVRYSRKSHGWS